ncbi:MAG: MFS transporter [Pseudoclavibacter sp.]
MAKAGGTGPGSGGSSGAGPRTVGPRADGPRGTWLVLIAVVLIAFNLRTAVMGFVPVLDVIGDDIGYGSAEAGVLATIPTFIFGVAALAGPVLFRLAGGELLLLVSAAAMGSGIVLRSLAHDVWMLGATFAVAMAGIGLANAVLVPVIKQYYAHRLGIMNGLYLGIMQIGPIAAPVVVAVMIESSAGWRLATGIWAIPAVLALVAWGAQYVVVRRWDANPATGPIEQIRPEPRIRFSLLVRSRLAWGIMGLFSINSMMSYTLQAQLPGRLQDVGYSLTFGASMLSIFALGGTIGSLVVPTLLARMRRPFIIIAALVLSIGVGLAGLLWLPATFTIVWVVCIAIGMNNFPAALTLMNLRSRTRAGAVGLSGFGQGLGYLIASVGPMGVGLVRSWSDSWTLPLALLIATVPISLVCGWLATRERMIEDELPSTAR